MRMPSFHRWISAVLLCGLSAIAGGQTHEIVHSFTARAGAASLPLLEGSDGKLLGVDSGGGSQGYGEIFVLTPDGLGGFAYTALYTFIGDSHGKYPSSGLVRGDDEFLYGTMSEGGPQGFGSVFRVDENGNLETVAEFSAPALPNNLILSNDGNFYGITFLGGDSGSGSIFRMDAAGTLTVLESFTLFAKPVGNLVQGADGALYGCLADFALGGPDQVFRLTLEGDLTIVHFFAIDGSEGNTPVGLVLGTDGNLYGATYSGGTLGYGTIFRVDGSGTFTILHQANGTEGLLGRPNNGAGGTLFGSSEAGPYGSVYRFDPAGAFEILDSFSESGIEGYGVVTWLFASDGNHYGVAGYGGVAGLGSVVRFDGVDLESVHAFRTLEGWSPQHGLIDGGDGWLYGTTPTGGAFGLGTVFRVDTDGAHETFHAFAGPEGRSPSLAGGILAENFFGTAFGGPTSYGTFFQLDATGEVEVLHEFDGSLGFAPSETILASDGNFYGVSDDVILRIDSLGTTTVLVDGLPNAQPGLTQGTDGKLYGVQSVAGAYDQGRVFAVDLSGVFQVVHDLTPLQGREPNGGLLLGSDGALYGTTLTGGVTTPGHYAGTVFRLLDPSNPFVPYQTLYAFSSFEAGDGGVCNGDLVEGSDGYLYGTTTPGTGDPNGGTVFRLDKAGHETVIHRFGRTVGDGLNPRAGLVEAADGKLYGTTELGGAFGAGTVYRIDPSTILPVMSVSPSSGPAEGGTPVVVTGQGFQIGASVSIGIEDATDAVVSSATEITASTPVLAPGMLHHVFVHNPDGTEGSLGRAFLADFPDVPQTDFFHSSVETIFRNGITAGCGLGNYCRNTPTTRAQMAVFLLKSLLGRFYNPSAATGTVFSDVGFYTFAAAWIEDLAGRGITAGCGGGAYCPHGTVTRAQMAIFLLKTLFGAAYTPPPAVGIFDDVPVGSFGADWIEDIYDRGITAGCSSLPLLYCPDTPVTRGQMAALLVATFALP